MQAPCRRNKRNWPKARALRLQFDARRAKNAGKCLPRGPRKAPRRAREPRGSRLRPPILGSPTLVVLVRVASLHFVAGTLELRGLSPAEAGLPSACVWDARTRSHRAPACEYAPLVLALREANIAVEDQARAYTELEFSARVQREPRPFQREALAAFKRARGRGIVVLPTGAGKSHVAVMAIDDRKRSALVVAPTVDLVRQWYDLLRTTFGVDVGVVGGGEYSLHPLTVTTYDSAYLHMENFGARFGLVVFDECHHLPAEAYAL